MSFWQRMRRRGRRSAAEPPGRGPGPGPGPVVGGFAPSGDTGRTVFGKPVIRIGDPEKFRQEDALRDRARSALDPGDEAEARAVADLVGRYAALDRVDSSAAAALKEEVRSVGLRLCRAGGPERLKLVAYRVQELSPGNTYGTVRSMESFWDGICGWQV